MKKPVLFFFLLVAWSTLSAREVEIDVSSKGLTRMSFADIQSGRNLIDRGESLGRFRICFERDGRSVRLCDSSVTPVVDGNSIKWETGESLAITQEFLPFDERLDWFVRVENHGTSPVRVTDLALKIPVASVCRDYPAQDNFQKHASVNKNASYIYWSPFDGTGTCLLMMPGERGFEYQAKDNWYYLYSVTSVNRTDETWSIPSSSTVIGPGESETYGYRFTAVDGQEKMEDSILAGGGVNFRVAPSMVIPRGQEVKFALRSNYLLGEISPQYPQNTKISSMVEAPCGFKTVSATFDKLGENTLLLSYGDGKEMCLEFFVTEDLETLIRKRSKFIITRQQHTDSTKWYDGLYSVYDMKLEKTASPDDMGDIREKFIVGGSDDPSNSKPMYVSEKNVTFPDAGEIASLEYYEKNFVWGKLQRTDKEYPYPYGIYGSDNWYENRSGAAGDYNSGGLGKERMWRTFDYVTHIAIYYNLYLIARDNPSLVHYLDKDGYLDRAFHTAMAYFEVPYNILMGDSWSFHGWCDWAYKQGNFHERYILELIDALEENGRKSDADKLLREWEKKVAYMVYEEEWPFGSEMFVDRTAFESSYYIGEYALTRKMVPQERFWYDKNRHLWYSYKDYPEEPKLKYMDNQLRSNLTLRGIFEPGYYNCGAAWTEKNTLDYMSQMGGVALLDYAVRFSDAPADIIRYGYNSLLSSWALVNSGDAESDYGYWYPGAINDGAAGWVFSVLQDGRSYGGYLPMHRGAWRIDGEIDHGFTGAVHGTGCYIVNDPVFGEIAYGGKLVNSPSEWSVTLQDGVRRYVAILQYNRFEMKLESNGISPESPVTVQKDFSAISFTIEKRVETDIQHIHICGLPEGQYELLNGDKVLLCFSSADKEFSFPIDQLLTKVRIRRR